jgi:hypothetical protein
MAKKVDEPSFQEECATYLDDRWNRLLGEQGDGISLEPLGKEHAKIKGLIRDCLRSKTKSYRYVLPTQLLAKCVDSSLDCRSLQASFQSPGAFDARTIAHDVIVPFDRKNHEVLGGSPEPYVNNPLRCPSVTRQNLARQKNKADWKKLAAVLERVEREKDDLFTSNVFGQVLFEIYNLLDEVKVIYPVPNRISLRETTRLVETFLETRSGGDRLEAVASALFRVIGSRFRLFDDVKRQRVNVADASSGMVADIECWNKGKIVLMVEVKDRNLTLVQMESKLGIARSKKINEILFMAQEGIEDEEEAQIAERVIREFSSGQNIYISDLISFATSILTVLGEMGRAEFLHEVGSELDRGSSSISHRKAWAALLQAA